VGGVLGRAQEGSYLPELVLPTCLLMVRGNCNRWFAVI